MGRIPAEIVDALASSEVGVVERCVALKGKVRLDDDTSAPAFVCQTACGVWLVSPATTHAGILDLSSTPCKYIEKATGDQLEVGGQRFGIGIGDGGKVKEALGRGRLLRGVGTPACHIPAAGPFVVDLAEVERAWLQAWLSKDEELLAFLETGTTVEVNSPLAPSSKAPWRYVLTSKRGALVALSDIGDVRVQELPATALALSRSLGGTTVTAGDTVWRATRTNGKQYRQLCAVPGKPPSEATAWVAQLAFSYGNDVGVAEALRLLESPRHRFSALDRLAAFVIGRPVPREQGTDAMRQWGDLAAAVVREETDSTALVTWLTRWRQPPELAVELVAACMGPSADGERAEWTLALHEHAHGAATHDSDESAVAADIALAEHLLLAGRTEQARTLVERSMARLGDTGVAALLPDRAVDATMGTDPLRIRLLELHGRAGAPAAANCRALAACQPLNPKRLSALLAHTTGRERRRVKRVISLLQAGRVHFRKGAGPSPSSDATFVGSHPLSSDLLEVVRHPATRRGGLLGRLQAALARTQIPDEEPLRAHCERVNFDAHPGLSAAIRDGCLLLGMAPIEAYLSHGDASVGLRAFGGQNNFLLVGADHLRKRSEYGLDEEGLRFAVGAELAHVRFRHVRATSEEVYQGVWQKGRQALELAGAILPLLKFVPLGKVVGRRDGHALIRSVVPPRALKMLYSVETGRQMFGTVAPALGPLFGRGGGGSKRGARAGAESDASGQPDALVSLEQCAAKSEPSVVTPPRGASHDPLAQENDKLVVAHRVMQLTADRVGLVLSGDIVSAVRALFLTSRRYRRELDFVRSQGLVACLSRRDARGELCLQDLTVRVSALISFFLSDEYVELREACRGSGVGDG